MDGDGEELLHSPDKLALLIKGLDLDTNPQHQELCLRVLLNLAADSHNRKKLEDLGVIKPIVRLLSSDNSSDVMRMYACWALSNLTAEGPSAAVQEELEAGGLLRALKRIFVEDRDNPDVLEKVLWLLTNITTDDYPRNKALVASAQYGFLELLTSLLDFSTDEDLSEGEAIPLSEMEYPEQSVTGAASVLLNLFFDAEVQAKFISQPRAVQQVVSLLMSASRSIRHSMTDLLVMLSAFDTETRALLMKHQAEVRLTKMLNEPNVYPEILESAIKSASNIALEEDHHAGLLESGLVLALVDMLTRPDLSREIKNEIATALQTLSPTQEVRDIVFKANAVPPLLDLMTQHLNAAEVETAAAALEDVLRVIVMLTLDADKKRELVDKHEVDVFLRRIARAQALKALHEVAVMGLEQLNASLDGPMQRRPTHQPPPALTIQRVATLRRHQPLPAAEQHAAAAAAAATQAPAVSTQNAAAAAPIRAAAVAATAPASVVDDERFYMKRKHIAKEILETEKTYVLYLGIVKTRFMEPLEAIAQKLAKPWITQEDIRKIFSVIRDILEANRELLSGVESALVHVNDSNNMKMQLGQPFLNAVDRFKVYSAYVNNYDTSIEALDRVERQPQWKTFKEEVVTQGAVKELSSLLIMPIQRIPRYLLLLQDLLKNTPRAHPDHPLLTDGLPRMQELADWMESEKDKFEIMGIMSKLAKQIQGYPKNFMEVGRKPIKEGIVLEYVAATKRSRYRYLFVFSDVIMLTEQKKARRADRAYKFIEEASLLNAEVAALPDTLSLKNAIKMTTSSKREYIFFFASKLDSDLWLSCLSKAIAGAEEVHKEQMKAKASAPLAVPAASGGMTLSSNALLLSTNRMCNSAEVHAVLSASMNETQTKRRGSTIPVMPSGGDSLRGGGGSLTSSGEASPLGSSGEADLDTLRRRIFPQTPEDIDKYKQAMISRYEAELKENAMMMERRRSMTPKERRMSMREEKKKAKEKRGSKRMGTTRGSMINESQP